MSSLRSTSLGVMRPPKPPCWRDFVVPTPKSINSEGLDAPDASSRAYGARSPVADIVDASRGVASLPGNKPSRLARRPRARIHRTRSEHVIHAEDLPDSAFTATLADTEPKGMRVRVPDGRLYVEENNRRCQNWLASIEAAEPLDEVEYTADEREALSSADHTLNVASGSKDDDTSDDSDMGPCAPITSHPLIPIHELQQGVDVEIPEETFVWDRSHDTRPQSASSEEDTRSSCKAAPTPYSDCRKTSGTSLCSQTDRAKSRPRQEGAEQSAQDKSGVHESVDMGNVSKCDKKSCGKKLYKLCCDHEKPQSGRQSDSSECIAGCEGNSRTQISHGDIQNKNISHRDSRGSSKPRRVRSSTRRSSSRRHLSDTDLWALDLSTSE